MPLPNRFDSLRLLSRSMTAAIDLIAEAHFLLPARARILRWKPCGGHAPNRRLAMTRRLTSRFAILCATLLLAFWVVTGGSVARADSDDGIVRVKSAVPMTEAISRIKADIA